MGPCKALWVDSDIILDWLAQRHPWHASAKELLQGNLKGYWELYFSPLTLANVHYVFRKRVGTDQSLRAITTLLNMGNVVGMDASHVKRALANGCGDFEDEMQMACASQIAGLGAIITRNLKDYRHSTVPVVTAEAWLEQNLNG